jgi:hypothetical protein
VLTDEEVMREFARLFGGEREGGLRVTVPDAPHDAITGPAALRELVASMHMHDPDSRAGELMVDAPHPRAIARGLSVLAQEENQKALLDRALGTFGRRVIDPLARMLDKHGEGATLNRLGMLRDLFLVQVRDLGLSHESEEILLGDLRKLLDDGYLSMVAEHEERVQRPRGAKLAQSVLRAIGSTFHAELARWKDVSDEVAARIAGRLPRRMPLGDCPRALREAAVTEIEDVLWKATHEVLAAELERLFAKHRDLVPVSPDPPGRAQYRKLAEAAWTIVTAAC